MDTVFNERPVWEAQPVAAQSRAISGGEYIVQPGDTLSAIGERSGAGREAIAHANGLTPPYNLRVGQRLSIPTGRFHKVAAGETGIAIARAYGVAWADIVTTNGLSEPFILKIGQNLQIPGTPPATELSIEDRASAFKLDIDDILTGGEPAQSEGSVATTDMDAPTRPLPPGVAVGEPSRFTGNFIWPVRGNLVARFGPAGEGQVNQGIEIATAPATPIKSSADGVVAFVGNNVAGYGGMILIRHGNGWITAYGRAASTTVTRGQNVKRGDIIGATGIGSGPKLHFEMRQKRVPIDPLKQLPPI